MKPEPVNPIISDEQNWMFSQLSRIGLTPVEPPVEVESPFNITGFNINTIGGNVVFRSVLQMFSHEIKLLFFLQGKYSEFFPSVLSIDVDKNRILIHEPETKTLVNCPDIKLWKEVIQTYSIIQFELTNHLNTLAYLECPDRRPWVIKNHLFEFLDNPDSFENQNQEYKKVILKNDESKLKTLTGNIRKLWNDLLYYQIPPSLEYGNFSPEHIYLSNDTFCMKDLTCSSISHPFFSMSCFLDSEIPEKVFPEISGLHELLRDAYLEPWQFCESRKQLTEAFDITRKLSGIYRFYHQYYTLLSLSAEGSSVSGW
jgi:hypothetical protein